MTNRRTELDDYARLVLARWLRTWRWTTGASQRTVARLAGIDQGGLSRVERGLDRPSAWRLARIIVVLDWLSGGGDRRGPWAPAVGRGWQWGYDRGAGPRPPALVGRPAMPPPDWAPDVDMHESPRGRTDDDAGGIARLDRLGW